MSHQMQTHIFLPIYLLQYVRDISPSKIDTDLFLTEASTSRLLEVIHIFCPNLKFNENAKNDRQLLETIFRGQAAHQLSNHVLIPKDCKPSVEYFSAVFKAPIFRPQDSEQTITCAADFNSDRTLMFTCSCLTALRHGQYHLASENLIKFLEIYKYLTKDEYSNILGAQDHAEDTLHSHVIYLQQAHASIEGIQLLMREADISANHFQDLEVKLKAATITLQCRQKMFERSIQDVAFLTALGNYHQNKTNANGQFNPHDSSDEAERIPSGGNTSA
ncbi:uncharacterized protein MELLADRAFT_113269 [Melampsora larici-populina 98AG31]|uniref:Uncharacterized protein n=1 Tax=Melampsora larici-populina (strain 98AG31 / pathotype 3-4-7) TaxID=747676 RepID=F4S9B1_MELLP|nr:uncharacterized protein MELLADRAFT_113269 [Melampsora larici-populina 98AG31]EGF98789.1 hypothetical protein MELLADRAFT_113269 [Melampsora larici-populina 98AG31]